MAQITIFEGIKYGADYIMSFYLVLCGANYKLKKWRKLHKYFFSSGGFWRKLHTPTNYILSLYSNLVNF
jgi:hypothetical protein